MLVRMLVKSCSWCAFRSKALLLANVISFSIQGVLLTTLLWLGAELLLAVITAKGISWGLFLFTISR